MSENMFKLLKNSDDRMAQIQKHLAEFTPERLQDELDNLILSTDGSEDDLALIDAYLAELDKRAPITQEITAEQSLEDFHEKHAVLFEQPATAPAKKRRRPGRYLVLIAAVIAVVGLLAVQATGGEVFGKLARWSDDLFGISSGYKEVAMERDPEYAQLQQALEDAGITVPLVPKYLPEGYVQKEFYTIDDIGAVYARYECADAAFSIQIERTELYQNEEMQKINKSPEMVRIDDVEHYIMVNNGTYKAVWENGKYICTIYGVTQKEELCTMIESIYMEDLS